MKTLNIEMIDKEKIHLSKKQRNKIIEEFEKYGILKFSNFTTSHEIIFDFIRQFSTSFANDANRRKERFENSKIRNVDAGKQEIFLHSETSFSPSQPEIIWFYCVNPGSDASGKTVYCDGLKLWEKLNAQSKIFFLENPINYKLKIPINRKMIGKNKKKWFLEYPGVKNCYLNYSSNCLEFDFIKFAVEKTRLVKRLSFANHLLIPLESEPQILKRTFLNKVKLRKKEYKEIFDLAYDLTEEVSWKKNDLIMIDNLRFMHGRRKISNKNNSRDIVTLQTMISNFGFGSTMPKLNGY
tara:strand:+ start:475 stop:1362 length:888 start_codon:yes stop_codon:yes gene_type:complete